jgi:hypothetical protein
MKWPQVLLCGLLITAHCEPSAASEIAPLYQTQTIVTGQEEPSRLIGFAQCLEQVLVEVSGDPRLLGDPEVVAIAREARSFVSAFRYHDRMSGIPLHDEQGTRERPYDLIVDFDPEKIDPLLRSLEREPWISERPRIALFLTVRNGKSRYVLAEDGEFGRDMREGLAAAADRFGMQAMLPDETAIARAGLGVDTLPTAVLQRLDSAASAMGGDVALKGSIAWSDEDFGWIAAWQVRWQGSAYQWQIRGVGFDQAFRNGIGGAAQIFSGHGQPK